MVFSWDPEKEKSNRRKHRISFATAEAVFDDPYYVLLQDREVDGEARWNAIGMVGGVHILLVAYTLLRETENKEMVRIISARKATPHERRLYAQGN